ncbi:MAG TPA: sugar kinase [Phaeodactylibacter sp.]|nr:sugar kinase [Phaeodactylibacter sp.]
MDLVTVGTVAFDSIETPHGKADRVIGGAATYINLAASNFTDKVGLVAVVGEDFPDEEIKFMQKRGINTEGLQIKQGEKSFFWSGRYHDNMNQRTTLITELNVLENFQPKLPQSYRYAKYLMLGNLQPEVQIKVIRQMKKQPKLIVMDTMNFWMDIAMPALKKTLKKVDVLTINDEEARQLSGAYSLVDAAKVILKMGPKILIIKKGEHGALLFYGDKMFYAPAMPLQKVADPTGAGDTFAGGFIGYLAGSNKLNFSNVKRAVVYGSTMASFCVEEFSIDGLRQMTKRKINKRSKDFKNLVDFDLK